MALIKFARAAAAGLALAAAGTAHATLVNDFELNGSLADGAGSAILTNHGGVLGPDGITFPRNGGPSITGLAVSAVYTLDLVFNLDDDGPGARYRKILDFKNQTTDDGLYTFYSQLDFYPTAASGTSDFTPGVNAEVTLSRDAAGLVTGYVDGVQKIQFLDTAGRAVIDPTLTLLTDEGGGGESSPGFVDYLRVYDQALTPADLPGQTPVAAVPEPATWATMLGGFGLVGLGMRRRRPAAGQGFGQAPVA